MKKSKLLIICISIFSLTLNAQIKKGTNLADLGIGISSYGVPIHAGFEHLITNEIGVGASVNYTSYKDTGYLSDYKWTFIYGGLKGNYHFNELLKLDSKFDVYGGLTLGYWSASEKNSNISYSSSYGNSVFFTGQIGARYFFADNIAALLEAGGGNISGLTAGVSFKF
ncbi:MAG: outer membrane beta-barrel protein [Flavobacterium sp.]|uniref:outer membrane beta-barrel protein n=1 Tax=Flavobacterium sp. TaxID=239 RepID=UPI002617BA6A|nr:outer membrane beta-barrel protein [Flavobacterium sp.]MDD5150469.1 outer membrane beta-barrel protein [Flavobacterium sp.]